MTTVYVETSALVSVLIEGDLTLAEQIANAPNLATSALTAAEAERAILRGSREGGITPLQEGTARSRLGEFLCKAILIEVGRDVLDRAGRPFPVEPVRTLEAIHLSSICVLSQAVGEVLVISRDDRVRENADALGFEVRP